MISLAKALRVGRGDVVSFVGGGGKTTSVFRLAAELSAAGLRVVSTTTTHISQEQVRMAPVSITLDEIDQLTTRLDQFGHCLMIGPPDGKGRVFGASSELVAALHARPDVDVVLVEADGSRSLPFKAPGQHEPVVPETTTVLCPIAGINSIGRPLDEAHVHRPELAAALAQQQLGTSITPQTLGRVLTHPQGGAKQCPEGARLVPMLNKADTDEAISYAEESAASMLAHASVDTVIISTMTQDLPVRQAWAHTAGIVPAAGNATCYREAARAALDAGLDPVIAVLSYQAEKVIAALAGLPVQLVCNQDFEAGQSSLLRKGLEALPVNTGAAVFLPAGQPFFTAEIIGALIRAHRQSFAPACVPVCEGIRGNPVLFDKSIFRELRELRCDAGERELLEKYCNDIVTVPADRRVLLDIDTPEEYERQKIKAGSP